MKISKDKVVSLSYTLRQGGKNGDVVEQVGKDKPFTFLFGAGNVLEQFETNLDGKEEGDSFQFSIDSENAYGAVDPKAVVEVPKGAFVVDGKVAEELLEEGKILNMQDQHGNPLRGKVTSVGDENVTMDFNHPMAGEDLFFSGEVVGVREATAEELDHGHVHGPGGHQH